MKRIALFLMVMALTGCASHIERGRGYYMQHHYKEAFPDLLQAAKEGKPEAQYAVGYMYFYGNGVNENRQLATYWISKAADSGYSPAQQALSLMKHQ